LSQHKNTLARSKVGRVMVGGGYQVFENRTKFKIS